MKFKSLLILLASFALSSCALDAFLNKANSNINNNHTDNNQNNNNQSNVDDNQIIIDDSDTNVTSINFDKRYLDLGLDYHKSYNLAVNFNMNADGIQPTDEEMAGTFSSLDESIAKVNSYGKVEAIKEGKTIVTYTTTLGKYVASVTVYVHNNIYDVKREYLRVDDVESIKVGDELIFASQPFALGASLDVYDGYIIPSSLTFSSDKSKLLSFSEDVAEYYVGPSMKYKNAFTLETQNNGYLSGRSTEGGRKIRYSKNGKDQINWIFEKPANSSSYFIVSADIEEDYWLMFNKINDSDYRFNLYDSNDTTLLNKPIIYRNTIIRN